MPPPDSSVTLAYSQFLLIFCQANIDINLQNHDIYSMNLTFNTYLMPIMFTT